MSIIGDHFFFFKSTDWIEKVLMCNILYKQKICILSWMAFFFSGGFICVLMYEVIWF